MLNICITFDYELFFGKSDYSVDDVLIAPTDHITKILDKYAIKATFFADIAMCIKHRNFSLHRIADAIDNQIIMLMSDGHDVQLHIHPFWYKAKYDGVNWSFDNSFYSFNSFVNESPGINEIISETKKYLTNLLKPKFPEYVCIAYRAGGFCIQPEELILEAMKKNGIIIDSSVCKRLYANTSSHIYDFSKAPSNHDWRFNAKTGLLSEIPNGEFLEIPIGSEYNIPMKWLSVHTSPKLVRGKLKGEISKNIDKKKPIFTSFFEKLKGFFYQGIMMSLDSSHYIALEKMINNFIINHDCKNNNPCIAMIGHPKLFSDENYINMEKFLDIINTKYKEIIHFTTITDFYKQKY